MTNKDRIDADFAEVLGVLLGDGCISSFSYRGKRILEVAFTGNSSELGYYRDFVKPVLERIFPVKGRLLQREDNTVRLHFRSVRLARYLLGFGIPLGRKRDGRIPPIVVESKLFVHFLRGFYQAEGSIYRRYSKRYRGHAKKYGHLVNVQIRCKLRTLMFQVYGGVIELGLKPTRMEEADGVLTFRFTDQSQVRAFLHTVRPRFKTTPRG